MDKQNERYVRRFEQDFLWRRVAPNASRDAGSRARLRVGDLDSVRRLVDLILYIGIS
jgi:hypothetical protein